ncbi:putative two-component sensor histidine kinase transcriptional regulatory protein [Rhizobium freirei PRF 81]|uniref:histidine kinase n=1 Tax=Rhizobium freirei PRF 81 TaxID=363754 RepID=N6V2V9_9HYPH|nr:sensor histidine kinase [Rhizobium freirei]ENN87436.1 putative two-component sensor histidine kinase transcriptional regulatory protein [Rhizobium freirei PRF 81]
MRKPHFPKASIGAYLIAIALAIALPILAFVALLLVQLENNERDVLKGDTVQAAQALARVIDRQLQDMATTLRLLSSSPELEHNDIATFFARTETVLRTDSLFVLLMEKDGQIRLNTRWPLGKALGKTGNMAALQSALDSGRIETSDVFMGSTVRRWVYNVTLPLEHSPAGAALAITQDADDLAKLITTEALPPGWSAAVIDKSGHIVAAGGPTTHAPGDAFNKEILSKLIASSGVYQDDKILPHSLLGYAQISGWSWKAIVWGPVTSAQSSLMSTWRFLIYGGVTLLLVALIAVYALARQVRITIQSIADMADRMGRGEIVAPIDTSVIEANQVAVALSNASFDRSVTEDRLHFVMHELVHRTKNLLALAQAMTRQLARQADSVDTFQRAVADRLEGLARSIEVLTSEQWSGVSLRRVIDIHLATFLQAPQQLDVRGNDFLLKPEAVQNLGLILHELATNSVKYGALSAPEGRIAIEWTNEVGENGSMIHFVWTESGGPEVKPPTETGFGTTVTKVHAAASFGGHVEVDFRPAGLVWTLIAPRNMMERERT